MDPNWYLLRALMIMVDGFILDARTTSREVQEVAYRTGLIPYIYRKIKKDMRKEIDYYG